MGLALDRWNQLMKAWQAQDFDAISDMYGPDSVYSEPYNPPHHGNLLTVSYLKDFLGSKSQLEIKTKRVLEDEAEARVAAEWSISYTAAGRRWNDLPRASFIDVDDDGRITYHRDYT
ncbi:MAG: nuclear transport factor 2 family protein [Actinobacteria bacterium]|nr:nuclear transport factor 2 family protein [Actinomycetota bacterium]